MWPSRAVLASLCGMAVVLLAAGDAAAWSRGRDRCCKSAPWCADAAEPPIPLGTGRHLANTIDDLVRQGMSFDDVCNVLQVDGVGLPYGTLHRFNYTVTSRLYPNKAVDLHFNYSDGARRLRSWSPLYPLDPREPFFPLKSPPAKDERQSPAAPDQPGG